MFSFPYIICIFYFIGPAKTKFICTKYDAKITDLILTISQLLSHTHTAMANNNADKNICWPALNLAIHEHRESR
jgi:hypothetical protein